MARVKHRIGSAAAINPDHIRMHRVIVAGVVVTLGAAIATSWNGLVFVGHWQLLPPEAHWLTPVMVDVPLIVLTLARGALRKRGIRAPGMLVGIVAMTSISSAANAAHTVALAGWGTLPAVVGTLMNALAPWLILAMTDVLWLVITKPIKPRRRGATRRTGGTRRPRTTTKVPATQPDAQLTLEGLG